MKESLLSLLRDKATSQAHFRKSADKLSRLLAAECSNELSLEETQIDTPLGPAKGYRIHQRAMLIPILRSGVALLPAFMDVFDEAPVGFIGIKRDEETAKPYQYYESIPKMIPGSLYFILDPMIATGGSALKAVSILVERGAKPSEIFLVGFVASKEGLETIQSQFPKVKIKVVSIDPLLNSRKFIVPGLGDFGDRYFGTAH